jgi:hypothetical protein
MTGDEAKLQNECFELYGDAPEVCKPWEPDPADPEFQRLLAEGWIKPSADKHRYQREEMT